MRDQLLEMLLRNPEDWFSGEDLANRLGVSRTAVWKGIEKLRAEGLTIDAVPRKGYRLAKVGSIFTAESVAASLPVELPFVVEGYDEIDSTNARACVLADEGAEAWTVVVAGRQTAGRGRRGRTFYSPKDCGLYMSVVVRPQVAATEATLLTVAAATAVAEAIEALVKEPTAIKWVNDVFYKEKKVSGILTEASLSLEDSMLRWAVVGIGINVFRDDAVPKELASVAGHLLDDVTDDPLLRSRLAADVLQRFYVYANNLSARAYLEGYRKRLLWMDKAVRLLQGGSERIVVARGVDEDGRLLVDNEHGEREVIFSGEVSLRPYENGGGKHVQ